MLWTFMLLARSGALRGKLMSRARWAMFHFLLLFCPEKLAEPPKIEATATRATVWKIVASPTHGGGCTSFTVRDFVTKHSTH